MARRQTYSGNMLGRGRICATLATPICRKVTRPSGWLRKMGLRQMENQLHIHKLKRYAEKSWAESRFKKNKRIENMKNKQKISFYISVAACLFFASPSFAGDAGAGEKVFKKCKSCHVVDAEKHKTGPHLVNLFGRTAGSAEGFKKYSKAIQESGIVWDEQTIDAFLAAPKKYLKGTKMAFAGLKKEEDRANVIAYLKQFSN